MYKKKKAYTLIEVVLVLGIVLTVVIFAIPISLAQTGLNKLENATKDIVSQIYVQQQSAFARLKSKSYGIHISSNSYTLYEGENYSVGSAKDDFPITPGVTVTDINLGGASEINFLAGSLKPSNSGTIRLTDGISIYIIDINDEGFITHYKL